MTDGLMDDVKVRYKCDTTGTQWCLTSTGYAVADALGLESLVPALV